jgi:hypothetical protein
MYVKDPKPEIMRLEELALLVKAGEIKLPRFQRPFVWKEPDMLKLLDSIYKGYPIGSILIWNSSQKLMSERSILGLEVNVEENSFYPTNYLLDGQQRLTTLCGALFWNGADNNSIWNIHFDLEREEFLYPKESNLVTLFPLNKIIKTSDFIKQCMKFDHHDKRDEYYRRSERLLKSIKDYKIAVVKIGDMTIDEVAPIFERINSTGRKLTIVDLMMAATWSNGFDLTSEIQKIKAHCKQFGFDEINDPIILRTISASADLGINKDDIQKLRTKKPTELCHAADDARESLGRALMFLQNQIGIYDVSYIPYGFQLTYLAEYFRIVHEPDPDKVQHLIEWFWFTSVTRYFASANTGQVSKDLNLIREFATEKIGRLFESTEIDISQLLYDKFNLRNATSTTFAMLLNSMKPSVTLDGKVIDGGHLKIKSSKFFTSFSPKNGVVEKLNISKVIYPYPDDSDGFLNRVNREISSKIETFPDSDLVDGREILSNVEEHLLDRNCIYWIYRKNETSYLTDRSKIVAEKVQHLTGCSVKYTMPVTPNDDIDFDLFGFEDEVMGT